MKPDPRPYYISSTNWSSNDDQKYVHSLVYSLDLQYTLCHFRF